MSSDQQSNKRQRYPHGNARGRGNYGDQHHGRHNNSGRFHGGGRRYEPEQVGSNSAWHNNIDSDSRQRNDSGYHASSDFRGGRGSFAGRNHGPQSHYRGGRASGNQRVNNDPTPFSVPPSSAEEQQIPRKNRNATMEVEYPEPVVLVEPMTGNRNADENMTPLVLQVGRTWDAYTPKEKYSLLLPNEKPFQFPILETPDDYDERKNRAVETTLKYLTTIYPMPVREVASEDSDDSDDSNASGDDGYQPLFSDVVNDTERMYNHQVAVRQEKIDKLSTFVKALPNCTPLDLGYVAFVDFVDADAFCWCPCQDRRFWRWRQYFSIDQSLTFTCVSSKFTPRGLRNHLRSKKEGLQDDEYSRILHTLVYEYLTAVYSNFCTVARSNKVLDHKAHYENGTKEFKEAEAAQNEKIHKYIQDLKSKLEQEKIKTKQSEEKINELEKTNKDEADKLREKTKEVNKFRDMLKIEKIHRKKSVVTQEMVDRYDKRRKQVFKWWKDDLVTEAKIGRKKQGPLKINVEQNFHIRNWFLSILELDRFSSDLNDKVRYLWLQPTFVEFDSIMKVENEEDDTMAALDDGGPSRAFISEVWRQMRGLTLIVDDCEVELFGSSEFCVPSENETIFSKLKKKCLENATVDEIEAVKQIIRPYYILLGRFLVNTIGDTPADEKRKRFVASHVLPKLYRYYYLKDVSPLEVDYPLDELLDDVIDLKFQKTLKSTTESEKEKKMEEYTQFYEEDEEGSEEIRERFRKAANKDFIDNRSWAVESIAEGLSLGDCFEGIPMNVINVMCFSKLEIGALDIFACFEVEYGKEEYMPDAVKAQQAIICKGEDALFSKGYLPELLFAMELEKPEFLLDFVEFVTGSRYIPHPTNVPKFQISVEFSFEEMSPDGLPVAHTCVNLLKLPGFAYDGNKEVFISKLLQSMESFKAVKFDMQ